MSAIGKRRGPPTWAQKVRSEAKVIRSRNSAIKKQNKDAGYRQVSLKKIFGTHQSPYGKWLKEDGYAIGRISAMKGEMRALKGQGLPPDVYRQKRAEIMGDYMQELKLRYKNTHGGQTGRRVLASKKGLKKFFQENGKERVSTKALGLLKALDGNSPAQFLLWHRKKFDGKPNISDAEVMLWISETVYPHVSSAIDRADSLSRAVQLVKGSNYSSDVNSPQGDTALGFRKPPGGQPHQFKPRPIGRGKNPQKMTQPSGKKFIEPMRFAERDIERGFVVASSPASQSSLRPRETKRGLDLSEAKLQDLSRKISEAMEEDVPRVAKRGRAGEQNVEDIVRQAFENY
jgi:hypothetical protein